MIPFVQDEAEAEQQRLLAFASEQIIEAAETAEMQTRMRAEDEMRDVNAAWTLRFNAMETEVDILRRPNDVLGKQLREAKAKGEWLLEQWDKATINRPPDDLRRLMDAAERQEVLSTLDRALLRSFLEHAVHKRAPYKDPAVRHMAIHFSSVMGLQNYLLLAELWKLPKETWMKQRRQELREVVHIGNMPRQWDRVATASVNAKNHYIGVIDETRAISKLEGLVGDFGIKIVGDAWPPDPSRYPVRESLPVPKSNLNFDPP